jgi:histidinol dehydrogenase
MRLVSGFNNAEPLLNRYSKSLLPVIEQMNKAVTKGQLSIERDVRRIINKVRTNGDKAIYYYTYKYDGIKLNSLAVDKSEITDAYEKIDAKLISILNLAAKRISDFHKLCKQNSATGFLINGLGRRIRPLNRVGIYIPGGTASYPSTVLMTVIPARAAGVNEIIMTTPPNKEGTISPETLVAADIAKVDRIVKIGGAQAIAALAYGTESVPKVDKICGPGNIFVATAKKQVFGEVGIDGIQGPSEVVIVADDSADVSHCAADLIAQAEHDPMASAILITTSSRLFHNIEDEIIRQLTINKRKLFASASLKTNGIAVLVSNLEEAIDLVNMYAPEHLLIIVSSPGINLENIRHAGCIFVNDTSPVALGDYIAGPSHVLPTGGTARFSSPLSIEDFIKVNNIVALNKSDLNLLGPAIVDFANAEGLPGHANTISIRLKGDSARTKHE